METSTYFPMDVDAAKDVLIRIPNEIRESNIPEKDNRILELAESSPDTGVGTVKIFQEHTVEQIIDILVGLLILVIFDFVLWFIIIGITKLIQKKIHKIEVKLFKITLGHFTFINQKRPTITGYSWIEVELKRTSDSNTLK